MPAALQSSTDPHRAGEAVAGSAAGQESRTDLKHLLGTQYVGAKRDEVLEGVI